MRVTRISRKHAVELFGSGVPVAFSLETPRTRVGQSADWHSFSGVTSAQGTFDYVESDCLAWERRATQRLSFYAVLEGPER